MLILPIEKAWKMVDPFSYKIFKTIGDTIEEIIINENVSKALKENCYKQLNTTMD